MRIRLGWSSALVGACLLFSANPRAEIVPDSAAIEMEEATVRAKPLSQSNNTTTADFIRKIPTAMNDPIRAVSYLPGVTIQSDLNIRPMVRGGNADQTQVVWNDMPFLQPYHVGGVFSVFNLATLQGVELDREHFQVQDPGALSGVLRLKPHRPSMDDFRLETNVSLVRGDGFVEVPVVPQRMSAYLGGQLFLFNRSLHGLLDLGAQANRNAEFQQQIQSYRNHINLPDFQDLHWGTRANISEKLQLQYDGGLALDRYTVVIPKAVNIISTGPTPNPISLPPVVPKKEVSRTKKLSIDSISSVGIDNQFHFLALPYDVAPNLLSESKFGYQTQAWDIAFKAAMANGTPLVLQRSTQFWNFQQGFSWDKSESRQFRFGFGYDYKRQTYHTEIPYVLYDMIVNSNMDMLDGLGLFTQEGFEIVKTDSTKSNFDYLGSFPSRIRFNHQGTLMEHFGHAYFSDQWVHGKGTLSYGMRAEWQNTSNELYPAPRIRYTWASSSQTTWGAGAGIYSQNNLPYYQRDVAPTLKAEKTAHVGLQWAHQFGKGYRFEVNSYYKYFYDMVSASLVPNGTIDLDALKLPNPGYPMDDATVASLQQTLDTVAVFGALPDSIKTLAYQAFGNLDLTYTNAGTGQSLGAEMSLFYRPMRAWEGWLSLDLSHSVRRDAPEESFYPYRYHRPVVLNWVNHFAMPSQYDISLSYRWAMGQPYTPYTGTLDGKDGLAPILVGARNSGRLAPYSRLDLRLTRNTRWFNAPVKAYLEVWNSMNDPNYFARDVNTGELKSAQLNWPFPLLFLGLSCSI
jgi:hypothetical protein